MRLLAIDAAAFIFPPVIIGTLLAFSSLSAVMLRKTPPPLPISADSLAPPSLRGKLKAAILVSNQGTQITDLLGPYELLAESGIFDVFTVAPKRTVSPTTVAVDLLPHYSFVNAPDPDLLVIPAVMDPANSELIEWVTQKAKKAKKVLVLCEGARLAVQARLFQNTTATSHFLAIPELREQDPSNHWVSGPNGPRYIQSGKWITSAGVTASLDATLFTVETFGGMDAARLTARRLGYNWNRDTATAPSDLATEALGASDFFPIFFRAAFRWNRERRGILLLPGLDEIHLAATLDVLSRSQDDSLFTLGRTRQVYRSAHGLDLVPTETAEELLPRDEVMIPSQQQELQKRDSELRQIFSERKISVTEFGASVPGLAYDKNLEKLLKEQGLKVTLLVARLIEYPRLSLLTQLSKSNENRRSNWPFSLWIKPILIGLSSWLASLWIRKRIRRAIQRPMKKEKTF